MKSKAGKIQNRAALGKGALSVAAAILLSGCADVGEGKTADLSLAVSEEEAKNPGELAASAGGEEAPAAEGQSSGQEGSEEVPGGLIPDQSFLVTLDGWGEVTFASFEPEYYMEMNSKGQARYGDVRFMLLKDDKVIYKLPGCNEENTMYGQQFGQVLAVAFRDYNGDGRMDILTILEYAGVQGPDIDEPFRSARLYTQEEGGDDFVIDRLPSEYLCYYTQNMAALYEGLEAYSKGYSVCTSKSVWEVERFARKVKRQILTGDFEGLSQEISYPITIDGILYQDEEEFLQADFIGNVSKEACEWLEMEPCENMFANWQGIMMGCGQVWIGEVINEDMTSQGLRVTALSGLTAQ